jgi:hypothetical protein
MLQRDWEFLLHSSFQIILRPLEDFKMIRLAAIIIFMAISFNAHAKNPGESAVSCVDARSGDGKVTFRNTCNEQIFVIWCGDLKYTKKRCGDGPKGGFYTHSDNIGAGEEKEVAVDGNYRFAACKGGISFGNDGTYIDNPNGGFKCLKR